MSITPQAASMPAAIPATAEPAKPAQPNPEELLQRREKMLKQQAQKLQQEKQKWESERKKYETDYVPKAELKDKWLDMLTEQGLTQEQIAQHLINTPNDPQTKAVMAKIAALEKQQADAAKASEQREVEQFEQVKTQMASDVKQLIATDATYEVMKSVPGAEQAVMDLIIEDFEKTGVLKDIDAACNEYEEFLIEEAVRTAQLPKVQARLKPKEETKPDTPTAATGDTTQSKPKWTSASTKVTVTPQVRTLSNNMQTTSSTKSTERQRIERAIAAFKGQPIT